MLLLVLGQLALLFEAVLAVTSAAVFSALLSASDLAKLANVGSPFRMNAEVVEDVVALRHDLAAVLSVLKFRCANKDLSLPPCSFVRVVYGEVASVFVLYDLVWWVR